MIYFSIGQLKFLPDETNTGQFLNLRANEFDTGDLPLRVFVIFGLKEQDLSDCHRSDDLCYGKVVWDEGFNLNSAEAQQGFLVKYLRFQSHGKLVVVVVLIGYLHFKYILGS